MMSSQSTAKLQSGVYRSLGPSVGAYAIDTATQQLNFAPIGRTVAPTSAAPVQPPPAPASSSNARGKRPAESQLTGGKEKKLAAEGHASHRSESKDCAKWVQILQNGANGTPGILAKVDCDGQPLIPFDHQRQAVKKGAGRINFLVIAHDAGTGKTATFFQLFAAIEILVKGGAVCVVSVPASTLPQWEQTAYNWLTLRYEDKRTILVTNELKKLTQEALDFARVIIISGGTLTSVFKTSYHKVEDAFRNERGQPCKGWVRKPHPTRPSQLAPLHPLLRKQVDLFGIDEAQRCRNQDTALCEAHFRMSRGQVCEVTGEKIGGCTKRVALSATPVMHDVSNLVGLCKAIDAEDRFQRLSFWCADKLGHLVKDESIETFQKHMDRVTDEVLKDIPPLTNETTDFNTCLTPEAAAEYNGVLKESRAIRAQLDKNNGKDFELIKLMGKLECMQQQLVSPHLARLGAAYCKEHPEEIVTAAAADTGSLQALREKLLALRQEGHCRVIVACNSVMPMRVAMEYFHRCDVGVSEPWKLFLYDGSLSLKRRQAEHAAFFNAPHAVLFLSIQAGGTGLHLVPEMGSSKERYCRAIVFWGARPFSPQQVYQTSKRINRIGQVYATEAHHLIADGSVDYGINEIHVDKKNLADAVMNGTRIKPTGGAAASAGDGVVDWRSKGRIVDNCRGLEEDGRAFEPKPPEPVVALPTACTPGSAPDPTPGHIGLFRNQLAAASAAHTAQAALSVMQAPAHYLPPVQLAVNQPAAQEEKPKRRRVFPNPLYNGRPVVTSFSQPPPQFQPLGTRVMPVLPPGLPANAPFAGVHPALQQAYFVALQQQVAAAARAAVPGIPVQQPPPVQLPPPPVRQSIPGIATHAAALAAQQMPFGVAAMQTSAALGAAALAKQADAIGGVKIDM